VPAWILQLILTAWPGSARRGTGGGWRRLWMPRGATRHASVGSAWIVARSLASLAYEVSAVDPFTWCVVTGVVTRSAVLATWYPARRAMRANPVGLLTEN